MEQFDPAPAVAEATALLHERAELVRAIRLDSGLGADTSALTREREAADARLAELWDGERTGPALSDAATERAVALRSAVSARRALRGRAEAAARAESITAQAARSGRSLSRGERELVAALTRAGAGTPHAPAGSAPDWTAVVTTAVRRDVVVEALARQELATARAQLRDGLLLTGQMRGIIREALPGLLRGDPVLLVGETGGAKTALAEHLSRAGVGHEPELVSGFGDITSAQLLGTHELRAEGGATVSAFVPGPLHRAMTEGRPVILDEVNAMPPEFLKRLNRILQLRPGDRIGIQENGGREIRIAQGFAILATANEQTPHRYRGLDRLSAELVNRFGANAYRVHYPDTGMAYEGFPRENTLLAAAAVADRHGRLPADIPAADLARVARAAFISQQVFAGEHGEGFAEYVSTERDIDGRPGLEESVLAPRTLVAILQKVAGSAGAVSLDRALTRFVEGIMHAEDRRVLALILTGQGFRIG
ncbi:AAA family ATPase [Leucobacter luti]|uniref:AAA family ATPase n=1 Tax=Leucobacter luti TaxID=340320 RepID=UPI003CFE2E9F